MSVVGQEQACQLPPGRSAQPPAPEYEFTIRSLQSMGGPRWGRSPAGANSRGQSPKCDAPSAHRRCRLLSCVNARPCNAPNSISGEDPIDDVCGAASDFGYYAQMLRYSTGTSASDHPVLPNKGTVERRHHRAEDDANDNPGPQIRLLGFVQLTHRELVLLCSKRL